MDVVQLCETLYHKSLLYDCSEKPLQVKNKIYIDII